MSDHYSSSDHKEWADAGLKDFGDYSDCVEYVNQKDGGGCGDSGQWYYADEDNFVIYSGRFADDESPGARVWADVYDDEDEFLDALADWEEQPEWLDDEFFDDDEFSDDEEFDEDDEFFAEAEDAY